MKIKTYLKIKLKLSIINHHSVTKTW